MNHVLSRREGLRNYCNWFFRFAQETRGRLESASNLSNQSNIDQNGACRDTRKVMQPKQPSPSAPAGATASVAPEKRHEKRLHLAVPVKVFPDVASVEAQNCCTYEISTTGARLVAPPGIKNVGQIIYLQRQNRRARYKVAWIGQVSTQLQGQVGVESLEPANVIWEPEIKARIMRS
jgi:hypothetical protein